jgi:hypothetical protein
MANLNPEAFGSITDTNRTFVPITDKTFPFETFVNVDVVKRLKINGSFDTEKYKTYYKTKKKSLIISHFHDVVQLYSNARIRIWGEVYVDRKETRLVLELRLSRVDDHSPIFSRDLKVSLGPRGLIMWSLVLVSKLVTTI